MYIILLVFFYFYFYFYFYLFNNSITIILNYKYIRKIKFFNKSKFTRIKQVTKVIFY